MGNTRSVAHIKTVFGESSSKTEPYAMWSGEKTKTKTKNRKKFIQLDCVAVCERHWSWGIVCDRMKTVSAYSREMLLKKEKNLDLDTSWNNAFSVPSSFFFCDSLSLCRAPFVCLNAIFLPALAPSSSHTSSHLTIISFRMPSTPSIKKAKQRNESEGSMCGNRSTVNK